MKTVKLTSVVALTAVAVLSFTSCQKNDINPTSNPSMSGTTSADPKGGDAGTAKPLYDEGFRSITSVPSGASATIGYVQMVVSTYTNQGSACRTFDLGGDLTSATSAKCYGAAAVAGVGKEAVVYNGADGYARISFASGLGTTAGAGTASYGGSGVPIMIGGNLTTLVFEEIEINPADGLVYGIVKNGNAIQLYKIDGSGNATAMTYTANGTTTIFYNPNGNGYKSGSIAFVEVSAGVYELAYATESTVYSVQGIVVWRYSVNSSANSFTINSLNNHTYAPAYLYGAQTGHINIASTNGNTFFARDNGAMYMLNNTNNSVTPVAISPSGIANSNDYGYYKAF